MNPIVTYSTILGAILRDLRKTQGWGEIDVAHRVNKNYSTIQEYERGYVIIPMPVLHSLAKAYGMKISQLFILADEFSEALVRRYRIDIVYTLEVEPQEDLVQLQTRDLMKYLSDHHQIKRLHIQ